MKRLRDNPTYALIVAAVALILIGAGVEIFNIAWGSGFVLGRLSAKWALALGAYILLAVAFLLAVIWHFFQPQRLSALKARLIRLRMRETILRRLLTALVLVFPGWLVFYSEWGLLFSGVFTRLLLFILAWLALAYLLSNNNLRLAGWKSLLASGLFLSAALVLAEAFVFVTDYPFAQYWSEGNRLWDYSLRFGAERYNYPTGEPIFAWIDPGRQTLWGLPFLIPDIPIWAVRLWSALVVTLPYALLGWLAFRPIRGARTPWLFAGLWSLIFLQQGPIYTPLVLSGILVAMAWRRPIWLALPLVLIAGHYAGLSRFTWSFAPGLWILMLVLGDAVIQQGRLRWQDWLRAAALALAGIWSKGLPILLGWVTDFSARLFVSGGPDSTPDPVGPGTGNASTLEGIQQRFTTDQLLWERLLPNEAFPPGIILGLLIAILPLLLLLIYLVRKKIWPTTPWSRIATGGVLLAFLVVGLIASAKVGGGLDLHNLDMLLVGLVLLAGLAWEGGFHAQVLDLLRTSPSVRGLLFALMLVPGLWPMLGGMPQQLPPEGRTDFVLERVQEAISCAADYGEVLLMDERQLLTFAEIENVPLVVDYEKKFVMDQALNGNADYFTQFSADLAEHRFALILTESQPTVVKEDSEDQGDSLAEENNAWAYWVTQRLLDEYESIADYEDVGVELFIPIGADYACP